MDPSCHIKLTSRTTKIMSSSLFAAFIVSVCRFGAAPVVVDAVLADKYSLQV